MPERKRTPTRAAADIRRMLARGGSAEHAKGVQRFFREEVRSHGWRTADLRRTANRYRQEILKQFDLSFLVQVADQLFSGPVLEEKIFAVLLLEKLTARFDAKDFRRFEAWLDRIRSWADHDSLVHYLIGPMLVSTPQRIRRTLPWAKSPDRWHRRAACVAVIQGARRKLFFTEITQLANFLLRDQDDMVQKGLGWLLRETAKADPERTIPYLLRIRYRTPRLVLRTACETLSPYDRARILRD
jgi:3-methyladenine DNA glycosylase AlkD